MTLKAPRPKRSHTRRPPKRAKPYERKRPAYRSDMAKRLEAKLDIEKRSFWPQAED